MTKEPLVSINMAAYNAGNYIAEAIQSVLSQTYQNWELIIINDCSSDNTAAKIAEFTDPRIKVFHNDLNEGIVYTRNRALHYSTGKYISVLDADDVYLPEKLSVQVDFLENHQNYGLVGSAFRFIDENSKQISDVKCWYAKAEFLPAILLFNNYFVHSSTLFLTSLAKDLLYRPLVRGYSPCEDYRLITEIAQTHKVYIINKELVHYRQHSVSISKVREDKINEFIDAVIIKQLNRLGITPTKSELELHKSIHFAFDNLELSYINNTKKWLHFLLDQNEKHKIYNNNFKEYLAEKWYEIARFNAPYGLKMLFAYFSSPLSRMGSITFTAKRNLILRCLYEFRKTIYQ
ncbi:MAG: glycosyltransferase family 2 protein [Bacteroidia bacterium]